MRFRPLAPLAAIAAMIGSAFHPGSIRVKPGQHPAPPNNLKRRHHMKDRSEREASRLLRKGSLAVRFPGDRRKITAVIRSEQDGQILSRVATMDRRREPINWSGVLRLLGVSSLKMTMPIGRGGAQLLAYEDGTQLQS